MNQYMIFNLLWQHDGYKFSFIKYVTKNVKINSKNINEIDLLVGNKLKNKNNIECNNHNDCNIDYMNIIKEYIVNIHSVRAPRRHSERANMVLNKISYANYYLDLGCGDGTITLSIANALKCPNAYGVDIFPPYGKIIIKDNIVTGLLHNKIIYVNSNDISGIPSTMDLVTIFMTLHHASDCAQIIKTAHDKLKPGGMLIIREHDYIRNQYYDAYMSAIHLYNNDLTPCVYKSCIEWTNLIVDCGFTHIETKKYPDPNPQRIFHAYFVKAAV
jgi:2-polyprenyl-3-methyl-5-hydroxy-6-metoxy-1,4-benzoquinol methylase